MFPLQRGNELVIQFSNSPHQQQQHKISQDLILDDYASLDDNVSAKKFSTSQPQNLFYHPDKNNHHDSNQHMKKMIHKEIERQRRQEMATCYASLRSLLPLHFIKGKRSISDHMNEAVNYIKHMQNNIKELVAKRDELKKLSNYSSMDNSHEGLHTSCNFTVHENNGVIGIEITSGFREERPKVSKLLQLLIQEGLEVVSFLSSEVNGRLLHSVQCEVNNSYCVDLSELRRKVSKAFPAFRCSD
ncbi:transcription factor bHLH118-like isoform X2 [Vigna unguiculata]|uniref:transcription factor bHLH118-like isoform X2 n=1 Tax=Vigna unguiculata TaxID=3917 RepID=UPI001015D387|nr:transcription factor bHLH118-like isoform X2 [Vigna unguiculata]